MWIVGSIFKIHCNRTAFFKFIWVALINNTCGDYCPSQDLANEPVLSFGFLQQGVTNSDSVITVNVYSHTLAVVFLSYFLLSLSQTGLQRHGVLGLVHYRWPSWPIRYPYSQAGEQKSKVQFVQYHELTYLLTDPQSVPSGIGAQIVWNSKQGCPAAALTVIGQIPELRHLLSTQIVEL